MRWVFNREARILLLAVVSVFMLLWSGCGDDTEVPVRRIYTVTYSLNITGESSVDHVTYVGGGKDIVFDNPTDGWSEQFPAGDGQLVGASAVGTVKNGAIILYMRADITGQVPITGQDECSNSEASGVHCALDIPKVRLP